MRWVRRLAMLVVLAWAAPTLAAPALPVMPGYKRTGFSIEEGAPTGVAAVAQTPDGFLWIGTTQGLWRFDGARFARTAALEKTGGSGVGALLVTRRGDLWIGYGHGGVAQVRDGRILPLATADAPRAWTNAMSEAPDGAIWVASGTAMFRYAKGRWARQRYGDLGRVETVRALSDGTVWACARQGAEGRLLRIDPRSLAATPVANLGAGACLVAQHPDGGPLVVGRTRLYRVTAGRLTAVAGLPDPLASGAVGIGRNGDAWTVGHGRRIVRVALRGSGRGPAGAPALFEAPAGAANFAAQPFEDREGNWWVGTDRGIDRFHPVDVVQNSVIDPQLHALPAAEDNAYQVLVDGRGTVFVRIARHFFRIGAGGVAVPLTVAGQGLDDALCASSDSGLWIRVAPDTVRLFGGIRARSVRAPSGKPPVELLHCFEDRERRLWLGVSSLGLLRYDASDRNPRSIAFDDRPGSVPYMAAQGSRGILTYIGYGHTAAFDGTRFHRLIGADSNPFTFTGAMLQRPEGLLLGGESGLGLLRGGRVRLLRPGENGLFGDVSGLVQNAAGETWLLSQAGLVRLPTAALSARLEGKPGALAPRIFDQDDGLPSRSSIRGFTDLVEAADGRLWFATQAGIYSLDPRRLVRNPLPPAVVVRAVSAGGKRVAPTPQLRLPAGTRSLEVDFTAPSLGVPRRVAFRYRLTGVDADWVDPGARREAIYTGLGPGSYRFQVIASNDDGVWNRTGAVMEITIPPTFVESGWFVLLCVLAALVAGWILYTLRIRQLNRRFDALLHERLDERARIARDLHDTLLQGMHGLMLRFQAIANRLPPDSALRGSADQALDRAEAVIVEGRDKVRDLRSEASGPPLEQRIADMIEKLAQDGAPPTVLKVEGRPRPLARRAADEAAAITEEALRNAHRHAAAERMEVVVSYGLATFTLAVCDDGCGIDPDEVAAKRREGHFGLVGMEERAARAGGTLRVATRRDGGTEVVLTIPALAAYGRQRASRTSFWRRGSGDGEPA